MLIPYSVDVLYPRRPWANWLLIATNVLAFVGMISGQMPEPIIESMVLDGWTFTGFFGSMFLHAGFWHLVGNMLFLWVFGNATCSRIGNFLYLVIYFSVGLLAAAIHVLIDGNPAVGASGAINGIVGLYLMLYPRNDITCFWFFWMRGGEIEIRGYWLIIFWLVLDIFGVVTGHSGVAYWAHLGGFFAGLGCGALILGLRWIVFDQADHPHLLALFFPAPIQPIEASIPQSAIPVVEEPMFYLYSDNQQLGPYPLTVVQQLLTRNQVTPQDLIFDPIANDWQPLQNFLSRR